MQRSSHCSLPIPSNGKVSKPRRSEMEMEIDILCLLIIKGPSKITHIQCKGNFNHNSLIRLLGVLLFEGLVEKRMARKQTALYAITHKGVKAHQGFTELKQVLHT
jgi:predicted transcriptional regulator